MNIMYMYFDKAVVSAVATKISGSKSPSVFYYEKNQLSTKDRYSQQ